MKHEIYDWLVDPDKTVFTDIQDDQHVVAWNTVTGRISVRAETLDCAIRKAYEIDKNPSQEYRIRATHRSTATRQAYTTGQLYDGKFGWRGHVQINELIPVDAEFALPKLPKGWSWVPSGSDYERRKQPARTVGYFRNGHVSDDNTGMEKARFHFTVAATWEVFSRTRGDQVLESIYGALVDFERNNFIIR